jgi:hypothetical protein
VRERWFYAASGALAIKHLRCTDDNYRSPNPRQERAVQGFRRDFMLATIGHLVGEIATPDGGIQPKRLLLRRVQDVKCDLAEMEFQIIAVTWQAI